MAKGAIIRYKIAEFNPWAGFSPNCKAVFVQTEHCAITVDENSRLTSNKSNMLNEYFI